MKKHMIWGITFLIFILIGIISVILFINKDEIRSTTNDSAIESYSNAEQQFLAEYRAKWGEDPASRNANWQHGYDNHGNVIRLYRNEATILEIRTEIGFAPTKIQYQTYLQLQTELKYATSKGNQDKVNRISNEIKQLKIDSQGPVPKSINTIHIASPGMSRETVMINAESSQNEAMLQVYREFGLEHLFQE